MTVLTDVQPKKLERLMRFVGSLTMVAFLALSGCVASHQTLEVRITPNAYQVGDVKSALATPAVDEVVRINPKRVLMVMCRNTPNAKIIQFEKELRAQYKAELQGTHTEEGCPD